LRLQYVLFFDPLGAQDPGLPSFNLAAPLALRAIDPNRSLPHRCTFISRLNRFGRGLTA
ncbi:hypothetical protein B0H10DRAFT_2041853, partial [Mycena sp. CBHHK59/15]